MILSVILKRFWEEVRKSLKEDWQHMQATRANRLAGIGLIFFFVPALLRIFVNRSTWFGGIRWFAVILCGVGACAFILAGLNVIRIEFNFMPRSLRGREE